MSARHVSHLRDERLPYGDRSPWSIPGSQFCQQWLSDTYARAGADPSDPESVERARRENPFPFLCSGGAVGTAGSLKRVLRHFIRVHVLSGEYDDQAILSKVLLRNRSLGFVDTRGEIFLQLHGHPDSVTERPLCQEGYLERVGAGGATFQDFRPPPLRDAAGATPAVLHFNGNGKRWRKKCSSHLREAGLLGKLDPPIDEYGDPIPECRVFDHDRRVWIQIADP